ncbi:MAG: hypothetical protein KJ072_14720, partial [Verrucomicrobia bacterium]|nr:hypothetical protein [Verrucomicrobiota bacterium]
PSFPNPGTAKDANPRQSHAELDFLPFASEVSSPPHPDVAHATQVEPPIGIPGSDSEPVTLSALLPGRAIP